MKTLLRHTSHFTIFLFFLCCTGRSFGQTTGDEIFGTWWNQERDGQIEIYKSGNTYAGKLIWMRNQNDPGTGGLLLDKKNPDEKLRSKPLLGSDLMYGFRFSKADKEWNNGKIYDGRKGKTYKCQIRMNTDHTLKVLGYIGASWMGLGETSIWTKIK